MSGEAHNVDELRNEVRAPRVEAETLVAAHAAPAFGALPTLIVLHGDGENAQIALSAFEGVTRHGWLLAAVQSSQVAAEGSFVWHDPERALADVASEFRSLLNAYPVDPERVVVAGFAQGGEAALRLALEGRIPARGVLLVAPKLENLEDWLPALRHAPPLRAAVLLGAQDDAIHADAVRALPALLERHGIPARFEELPHHAHGYPRSEEPIIRALLHVLPPE